MEPISFAQFDPGLFVVHYAAAADLSPELQRPLIEAIVDARNSTQKPTALVFNVATTIRAVDLSVPTFWLGITGRPDNGLAAIAIVTQSIAVRVAAGGFGLANTARGLALEVRCFRELAGALAWARQTLSGH